MNFEEAKQSVLNWVENFVEKTNPKLNGWPPCPFARQARMAGRLNIIEGTDFDKDSKEIVDTWDDKYDVVACVYDIDKFTPEDLSEKVMTLNKTYSLPKDILVLEDHPDDPEVVNDVVMNQGIYILVLFQRFSKVNDASAELKEKGYYDSWTKEYYDLVVGWREQYVFGDN